MTTWIVGPGGNDNNSGRTWGTRLATVNGAEDKPVVAGDTVRVAPGVYREQLTTDVSGGNTYNTGTVSCVKGSRRVVGSGTVWGGNVAQRGDNWYFHVRYYDQGTDGTTAGDNTFSASVDGNFQSNMIGMPIQINARGAYTIASVVDDDNITLADPNGLGWPAAGANLTYSVMSAEGHYEIDYVASDALIVLKQPWQGRTLVDLPYLTFQAIAYIADVTGEHTSGVPGIVRITGSDNDQTQTRATGISLNSKDYRAFRGFHTDMCMGISLYSGCDHVIIEDMVFGTNDDAYTFQNFNSLATTLRRCIFIATSSTDVIHLEMDAPGLDDTGIVIENCQITDAGYRAIYARRMGGVTVRNCHIICTPSVGIFTNALATGQCLWLIGNILTQCITALQASSNGEIIEDYNALWSNATARTNVSAGSNSNAYPALITLPLLYAGDDELSGFKFPWRLGDLSRWSQIAAITGVDERNTDLYGIRRPHTHEGQVGSLCSWGPAQRNQAIRSDQRSYDGNLSALVREQQMTHMWVPDVSNVSHTISVRAYRTAGYGGDRPPAMIIKQPGRADRMTLDAGAAAGWNLLTDTFTPAANPNYMVVELRNFCDFTTTTTASTVSTTSTSTLSTTTTSTQTVTTTTSTTTTLACDVWFDDMRVT